MVSVIESYVMLFIVIGDLVGGGLLEPASAFSILKSLGPLGEHRDNQTPLLKTTALVVRQQQSEKK